MTAKAMWLRIKVAQLNSLSVGKLPEYCNTWKCFTYSFEAEKQGEFFSLIFWTRRFESDARGDRKLLIYFFWPSRVEFFKH